jgi:SAM-dependent methyltransferase
LPGCPRRAVHDLLGRAGAEALRQAGLLTGDAECLGAVAVTPVGERLIAHDRRDGHQKGAAEFVPGPAPATRRFADVAIRRPGARVLDLGCGQGLLAVLAAEAGGQVTATDLNPRAVAFAAFNARLNHCHTITCVHGDLFAPVAGMRFDLIVANPPFVISPDTTFLYRDGRGICERIARDAPSFLADGGILQMVCNWPCHRDRDWREDLSAWFRDSGCDVWVLQTDHLDAATYAGIWLGQAHEDPVEIAPALDRWMTFYEAAGIDAVGGGVVGMRRPVPGIRMAPPWLEIREMPPVHGPSGETIARVLEARDTLARLDDQALLDARVALVPDAKCLVTQRPSTSGWERESSELRLTRGLAMTVRLDPVGTAMAGYLDGGRPARDAIAAFASAVGVPPDALMAEVPPLLRRLIEMGLAVTCGGGTSIDDC